MSPFIEPIPSHVISVAVGYCGTVKRIMDTVIAVVLLVLLLPVMVAAAALVVLDGGFPIYGHPRIGRRGAPFSCLKFRTMRPDAAAVLEALLERDPTARAEWETSRKLRQDPRVTRVGRLLRATSLDELPQLLNVLRGDMSLVGPRPVTQDELDRYYIPESARVAYLSVRPGITGPWQVGGRSELGYDTRVALDRAYAAQSSLRTDFLILIRTVRVVVTRRGAY